MGEQKLLLPRGDPLHARAVAGQIGARIGDPRLRGVHAPRGDLVVQMKDFGDRPVDLLRPRVLLVTFLFTDLIVVTHHGVKLCI